jgi:hypothetical protein
MVGTRVGDALGTRLRQLHDQLLELAPDVDRIACVLYDPQDDLLKTFVNSTRSGEAIKAYQFRLAESDSLSRLASSGHTRVLHRLSLLRLPPPGRLHGGGAAQPLAVLHADQHDDQQ